MKTETNAGPWVVERTQSDDGTVEVSVNVNTADLSGLTIVDYTHEVPPIPIVGVRSPEDLARVGGVPEGYILEWYRPNTWPVQTRDPKLCKSKKGACVVLARQARGTFKAPEASAQVAHDLIDKLRKHSPIRKPRKYTSALKASDENILEISIPDLHYGMDVWAPKGGFGSYSMDIAEKMFMGAIEKLLKLAKTYKYEYILFPIGNDYLHVDNRHHTTTAGTPQMESGEWHKVFTRGRDLLIAGIDRLKQAAPVKVLSIPGNHDTDSMLHMAMIMEAYYHKDPNVEVIADPSPIKYHEYGKNLLGFEHGRNIPATRLAGMMAEDQPQAWARTQFREWHLGDQHRKGGAWFQEQTVGIEYIPSLCNINAWHRDHGYTWRRAAMAYVWNKHSGPVSRLQVNVDPSNPEELLG